MFFNPTLKGFLMRVKLSNVLCMLFLFLGTAIPAAEETSISLLTAIKQSEPFQYIEFLMSKKVDVNEKGPENETPLIIASSQGRLDVVQLLLTNNANPHNKTIRGYTAFSVAKTEEIRKSLARYVLDESLE